MNAVELQYNCELKVKSFIKDGSEEFVPSSTWEQYLNLGQDILIRKYLKLIDEGEKAKKVLIGLISEFNATSFSNDTYNYPNGTYVDLTPIITELRFVIDGSEEAFLSPSNSTVVSKRSRVKDQLYEEYALNKDNPFKRTYEDAIVRLEHGAISHELIIPSGFSLQRYRLKYIREPQRIVIETNNSPEIDSTVHNELVDLAVELYIESCVNNSKIKQANNNQSNR